METIDVCICTFRRESIGATLVSISRQHLPVGIALRVIVADNDATAARQAAIEAHAASLGLTLRYVHAPERNISIARNACLDAAESHWIAFIDDDETARPDWMAKLLEARAGADVVFGTSHAVYASDAPQWMASTDFHSNSMSRNDAPWNGYTSNVLIDRRCLALHGIRFDLALGQTGGEDTIFFHAAHQAGARFAYASKAVVDERVPPPRASIKWLALRRFRAGQVHHIVLRREGRASSGVVAAAGKAAYCGTAALVTMLSRPKSTSYMLRGALHFGVLASALGFQRYREYGSA